MARRSLLPDAQRHQGLIRKEFAVNGSDLLVSVPDEFALGSGGWQVLWSRLPLKPAMMETLRGLVSGGGLVPWTYRNKLPFNLIFLSPCF